jgi:hypothetical protein
MTERRLSKQSRKEALVDSAAKYPDQLITAVTSAAVKLRVLDPSLVTQRAAEVCMDWMTLINRGGQVMIRTFEPNGKKTPNAPEDFTSRFKKLVSEHSDSPGTSTDMTITDQFPIPLESALISTAARLHAQGMTTSREAVKLATVELYTDLVNLVAGGGRVMVRTYNPGSRTPEEGTPEELAKLLRETSYRRGTDQRAIVYTALEEQLQQPLLTTSAE